MQLCCVTTKHSALTVATVDAACLATTQRNVIHNQAQDTLAACAEMLVLDSCEQTAAMHVSMPELDKPDSISIVCFKRLHASQCAISERPHTACSNLTFFAYHNACLCCPPAAN